MRGAPASDQQAVGDEAEGDDVDIALPAIDQFGEAAIDVGILGEARRRLILAVDD